MSGAPLEDAYDLLRRSITVAGGDDGPVRDSDVKRKMLQFEPGFDEGELGFGKFSRFLQQAEDAGVVEIRRTEDGNYQVTLGGTAPGTVEPEDAEEEEAASASGSRKESTLARLRRRRSSSRKGKRAGPPAGETDEPPILDGQAVAEASTSTEAAVEEEAPTRERETPAEREEPRPAEPADDEAAPESASGEGPPIFEGQGIPAGGGGGREPGPATEPEPEPEPEEPEPEPAAPAPEPEEASAESRSSLRMRRGSRKGSGAKAGGADGGPSLLEGQAVTLDESPSSGRSEQSTPTAERRTGPPSEPRAQRAGPRDAADEIAELNLPTDRGAITRYLANRYRGVGEKTAERLVDTFGTDVFRVLHEEPHRVRDLLTDSRAEQVLDAWSDDYRRRTGARSGSGVSS